MLYSFSSKKPKQAHLSKTLIALLSYGGVPREYFLDILKSALEETQRIYSDEILALKGNLEFLPPFKHGYRDEYVENRHRQDFKNVCGHDTILTTIIKTLH